MSKIEKVAPGTLGTCWYGRYHYVEPWAGCEHDCAYCYARHRDDVKASIECDFSIPQRLPGTMDLHGVSIAKLSRYTDVFSPTMASEAFDVLQTLLTVGVKRIIITTKGCPDERTTQLMERYPSRFSYNQALRPERVCGLIERALPPLAQRVALCERLQRAGLLTTIHFDPIIVGWDSDEGYVSLLDELQGAHLRRAMFSYLLINDGIESTMRERVGDRAMDRILEHYDDRSRSFLPKAQGVDYRSLKASSIEAHSAWMSRALSERQFEFVICSLKSRHPEAKACGATLCDGRFYA